MGSGTPRIVKLGMLHLYVRFYAWSKRRAGNLTALPRWEEHRTGRGLDKDREAAGLVGSDRRTLDGFDCHVLVADHTGINVWYAAGPCD